MLAEPPCCCCRCVVLSNSPKTFVILSEAQRSRRTPIHLTHQNRSNRFNQCVAVAVVCSSNFHTPIPLDTGPTLSPTAALTAVSYEKHLSGTTTLELPNCYRPRGRTNSRAFDSRRSMFDGQATSTTHESYVTKPRIPCRRKILPRRESALSCGLLRSRPFQRLCICDLPNATRQ